MAKTNVAVANGWKKGDYALFVKYEGLPEGADELLVENDPVKVVDFEGDADIIVVKVGEDGKELTGDEAVTERLYESEIKKVKFVPEEEEDDAEEVQDGPAAEDATDEEADDALPLEGIGYNPDATLKDLRAVATDNGQKATGKSKADVIASLEAMGAVATEQANATDDEPEAEDVEEETVEDEVNEDGEIVEAASVIAILDEMEPLDAAKELVNRAQATEYTLGGVLRNIYESGEFTKIGYGGKKGFADYVEQELQTHYRKAMDLIRFYTAFCKLGVDEDRLAQIGWSKCKELARLSDEDLEANLDELLEMAEDKTRNELVEHIKTSYSVATRGSSIKMTTFSFRVAEEDGESITAGLSEAMEILGEQDLNKAFAYIVGDWRNNAEGSDMTLEDFLAFGEAKFGVELTSSEPEAETEVPDEAEAEAEVEAE